MVRRILGGIAALLGTLALAVVLWVATHRRDLPAVDDADLRAIPAVAPEADAWPALDRAEALLALDQTAKHQLTEWGKGTSWDEPGVRALLARNAGALAALAEADGKRELALPPGHRSVQILLTGSLTDDPVVNDTFAWKNLARLRLLNARALARHGRTRAALDEIFATAQLGDLIESNAGGGLSQYMTGSSIKSMALAELVEVAAKGRLSHSELRGLAARAASFGANTAGFSRACAGEYRTMMASQARLRASSLFRAQRPAITLLVHAHVGEALRALIPEDYLYQRHRTEALWADFYRALQRDAVRPYAERMDNGPAMELLTMDLRDFYRAVPSPNHTGLIVFRMGASAIVGLVARKSAENVRSAATSATLALLAYEREHGALPERLDALVPEDLERLPIDDFDGAPLRYSRERRRLWSVGEDLKDEGGSDAPEAGDLKQPTFPIPG